MTFKERIGGRLRELRERKKLSLAEVERELKGRIQKSRLSNYEQGTRLLRPDEAVVLGNFYDVSAAHVMCLDDDNPVLSPQERTLIEDFRLLDDDDKQYHASRIRAIALARHPNPVHGLEVAEFLSRVEGQTAKGRKHKMKRATAK